MAGVCDFFRNLESITSKRKVTMGDIVKSVIIAALLVLSCGKAGPAGRPGEDGPAGANGANGVDGVNGTNGTDNHITGSLFCQGSLQNTSLLFEYHAAVTSYGDVFASASIVTASQEVGADAFYAAGQNGAIDADVAFAADVAGAANGGWWDMSVNRTTLVTTINYHDVDVTGGISVWAMPSSDCILNSF